MAVTSGFWWRKAEQWHRLSELEPEQSAARVFFIHSRGISGIAIANRLAAFGEMQVVHHEETLDAIISGEVAACEFKVAPRATPL